jgi:ketosteroid isomerase-like protein
MTQWAMNSLATTAKCASICMVTVMPTWAVPLLSADDAVVAAIRTMYAAAATDDLARFHSVAAVDFYSFDGGQRFAGDTLMEFIRSRHAQGVVYVWTVTEPVVHVDGDMAWITYVNRGSVTDASGTKNVTWLESAVLARQEGRWRIRFFHSTRVP